MAISWNQNQRDIFALFKEGKTFDQVVDAGYSNSTVARVLKQIKAGQEPPPVEATPEVPGPRPTKQSGTASTATIKSPMAGITQFEIGQEKIQLYPEDMLICFDHYRDMQTEMGWQSDFSSTIREGMKLLRTVVGNFIPEEVSDNGNGSAG